MGLRLVYQSPYSPDLNLCDRFLFKSLKEAIRPVQYDSNNEVLKAAQHCLLSLLEDYLINEFHKFLGHCKDPIRRGLRYMLIFSILCIFMLLCILLLIIIHFNTDKVYIYIYMKNGGQGFKPLPMPFP